MLRPLSDFLPSWFILKGFRERLLYNSLNMVIFFVIAIFTLNRVLFLWGSFLRRIRI